MWQGLLLAFAAAAVWAVAPVLYRRCVDRVSYTGLGAFRCIGYLASAGLYLLAVLIALRAPTMAGLVYVGVAVMWLVPDRRIARAVDERRV